jgi:hypothetical protein
VCVCVCVFVCVFQFVITRYGFLVLFVDKLYQVNKTVKL